LAGIDEREHVLLATSRIVYMHDPDVIDSAGDGVMLAGGAFKRAHGANASAVSTSQEVFGVCGAACLMPRWVFDELGGFDEDFFFSHEDVDLSYRARLLGYRCVYMAEATVRHHGGGTSGKTSAFAVFHGQRNLEWMYFKNTPSALLLRTFPGHVIYNAAAAIHFARIGCFGAYVRGKVAALADLPRLWRKRRAVQATRRVEASALVAQMEKQWLGAKLREKRFDVRLID
jgi:GT2 family glycosyltransferase